MKEVAAEYIDVGGHYFHKLVQEADSSPKLPVTTTLRIAQQNGPD